MATVREPVFTPDDLLRITDRPTPELIDGQLLEREPMGQEADAIGMKIVSILQAFGKSILPGLVNGPEGGYQIFADDPRRAASPTSPSPVATASPTASPLVATARSSPT